VTEFVTHADPEARVRQWLEHTRRYLA
jgi:hypothetical protein